MADVAIASFHLVDVDRRHTWSGLSRIGLDRRGLASSDGLRFWRLLGTGRDDRVAGSFRPTRRALFAVWEDDVALDGFLADSPIAARWESAHEAWHVRLRLISGHGSWGGSSPLTDLEAVGAASSGPVVTLTRAAIRARRVAAFGRHSRAVGRSLGGVPGLRAIVGVGEVPVVRLGTLAVWDDDRSAVAAAAGWSDHAAAMRAAQHDGWFSESLFARFSPYASAGTWSGADPVSVPGSHTV
jgi:hypothetical protein